MATEALGQRDGAIVILDPQTGRVRAVVNQQLAFQSAFPPGSTIKPFTALALLREGKVTPDTRMRCRHKYKRTDVVDTCSHPAKLPPFNPSEAIAYSCNYYFATFGERLDQDSFSRMLADFGFGQTTGIDVGDEEAGVLARGRWQPESAVGEGAFLQVTPIQLGMAYAALFNGGKLWTPTLKSAGTPKLRAQLQINDKERATLLSGMRGAVTFGTAEKAELASLSSFVIGKTGTSTPLQGFRPQGWFTGIAFAPNTKAEPADAQLLVVVYLKNGHGSEAAEVSRSIFAEFAGQPPLQNTSTSVTVKDVSENITRELSLEDYVQQVVAAEGSVEDEPEALKALAIAARTYALRNIGRHKEEGYDFCSTTHCQRFESVTPRAAVVAAVKATAGLVLRDDHDELADAYYSASCGGMTANLKSIWGKDAPDYLRGVRDPYCNSGPHYRWTDVIGSKQLVNALRSDPRTDVGENVRALSVSKYDSSGRAEMISIVGDRTRSINGWDFKLIVGRALGWQLLKSSRFNISQSGSQFVFRGGGFGHGLGLCQEGSHVMAQRGQSFQQILAHYFPGTSVGVNAVKLSPSPDSAAHFRSNYPRSVDRAEVEQLLSFLESNRTELLRRVSTAGIETRFPNLQININETTGDFVGRTRMPPWAAAATRNNRIELQPLKLLKQRRILETTLRHELVHVLIETLGGEHTPRWLTEGMAIYIAGEGKLMTHQEAPVERVEKALASATSAAEMQAAYAAAYNLVRQLIQREGEQKVWKRIADQSYSVNRLASPALTA
ncbi:MAG TPA: SpoIID/LytB domain-containing protein [Pyrinomonadaceae bacterium]